ARRGSKRLPVRSMWRGHATEGSDWARTRRLTELLSTQHFTCDAIAEALVKKTYQIIAATGTVAIFLAGCSSSKKTASTPSSSAPVAATSAPAPASSAAAPASINACMVLDTGGVDDHSFNQSSWQGLQDANKANPNIKI